MADDLCFSSSTSHNLKKTPNFQLITGIILHDLSILCSFIVSYPLYFSYFIFFCPYFIKLISFISPLFILTVILSLLTTTTAFCTNLPQLQLGILQSVIQQLKTNLHDSNEDDGHCKFEDFEICKIVFDCSLSITICDEREEQQSPTEKIIENSDTGGRRNDVTVTDSVTDESATEKISVSSVTDESVAVKVLESSVHGGRRNELTTSDSVAYELDAEKVLESSFHGSRRNDVTVTDSDVYELEKEKGSEKLFEESARFEDLTKATETNTDSDKVTGSLLKAESGPVINICNGSEAINTKNEDKMIQNSVGSDSSSNDDKFSQNSVRSDSSSTFIDSSDEDKVIQNSVLWNYSSNITVRGWMREEEWRRTLACKLLEERHNSRGGEEGMDSLWEAYEKDNSKNRKEIMKKKMLNKKDGGIRSFNDDDEMEVGNGHLCCLQALKLSTGKMNLGMGKLSKALKGFGWLHHVKNKHGKRR